MPDRCGGALPSCLPHQASVSGCTLWLLAHNAPLPSHRRDYRPSNGTGTGSFLDGSAHPAAETVYAAMHSGCPVEDGEKYIATRWIRAAGFDYHLRS